MHPIITEHFPDYPDVRLDPEAFPAIKPGELVALWDQHYGRGPYGAVEVEGVLGVFEQRFTPIEHLLSVDVCEVLRLTHEGVIRAMGGDRSHLARDAWYYRAPGLTNADIPPVVTVLINERLIEPVDDAELIAAYLQTMRRDHPGLAIVLNTSSLPGTEKASVEFLAEHYPDCFDGILFPRGGLPGDSPISKAKALSLLLETVNGGQSCERVIHIDDAPHHTRAILGDMGHLARDGICIVPTYEHGANAHKEPIEDIPAGALTVSSPLEAIKLAQIYMSRSAH